MSYGDTLRAIDLTAFNTLFTLTLSLPKGGRAAPVNTYIATSPPPAVRDRRRLSEAELDTRNVLAEKYAHLVPITVRKLAPASFCATDRADLEGFGYRFLPKAAGTFDASRAKFSTFALYILRQQIGFKINEIRAEKAEAPVSLDAPLPGKEGDTGTMGDYLPACPRQNPASISMNQAERDIIWQNVAAKCDKKQALVLHLHYGEEMPLTKIAEKWGQQPHQIAALRDKALKILREAGTKKKKPVVVVKRKAVQPRGQQYEQV